MVMTRLEIINEAKEIAGVISETLYLNRQYDWILKEITQKYPLIRNQQKTGETVADQNYIVLPPNFSFPELFKISGNEIDYLEPEDLRRNYDESDSSGIPSIWTTLKPDGKLYMHVPPSSALDYILYYSASHPKAGRFSTFTSGGTYEVKPGVTVTGATSGATAVVAFVSVTSGTWAGGTAAGTFIYFSQTGTFQSENLDVGTNLNVATVAGDSGAEDLFEHLLGDEFDRVIIMGVASEACLKTLPIQMEKHIALKQLYVDIMSFHGNAYAPRWKNTTYRDF